MKTAKLVPVVVLVIALTAIVGTIGYTVAEATGTGSGFGQMHRGSYAMMGSGGTSTAWYTDGSGRVRDIAAARVQAQRFADRLGLKTAEVMQFSNNFYVLLDDKTGHGATEVLVDPQTGGVTLEYGPAMMWNTRFGMMDGGSQGGMMDGGSQGGMMDGGSMMGSMGGSTNWTPAGVKGPVSAAQARQLANRWLALERPGAAAAEPEQFPGYFTMDTSRNGKIEGMLSVNRTSGAVWYHWWHGRFVAMEA